MSNKKKAALAAATVRDGNAEMVFSKEDTTTDSTRTQGFVESFLHRGKENAIRTCELMELTGLDVRQLRAQVEKERRNGTLILTGSQCGYFLPSEGEKGKQEISEFYNLQRAKALSLLKTIKTAKKALEVIDGQQSFEE